MMALDPIFSALVGYTVPTYLLNVLTILELVNKCKIIVLQWNWNGLPFAFRCGVFEMVFRS